MNQFTGISNEVDLTEKELGRIWSLGSLPRASAEFLAEYLLHRHKGPAALLEMIRDDIRAALSEDDLHRARTLFATLREMRVRHTGLVAL